MAHVDQLTIELPWPPSVNHYWRYVPGQRPKRSRGARDYILIVRKTLAYLDYPKFGCGRLSVTVDLYPPDRARRDIDNLMKALLDALQKAGAYKDDSQVDELRIVREEMVVPGGAIVVGIRRI